jgi:hypothetical protein
MLKPALLEAASATTSPRIMAGVEAAAFVQLVDPSDRGPVLSEHAAADAPSSMTRMT